MNFFLIGYMGAGKTTIGRKLSKKINYSFIDLDAYIETKYRHSLNSIFQLVGEEGFRIIENNALKKLLNLKNYIISTGGGTPCFYDNIDLINKIGISIYLKYNSEFLYSRLVNAKKKRPLLLQKNKQELLNFIEQNLNNRKKYYELANYIIEKNNLQVSDLYKIIKTHL